jgi:hypothetical protein
MPQLMYTVENMADEIRAGIDEDNPDSVDTERDILPAMNRAQDYAFNIYARKYPEPILRYTSLPLTAQVAEYEIPEDVFEDRIMKVEIEVPVQMGVSGRSTKREVQRISYRDISNYESTSLTNVPYYYTIIGRQIRFVPTPTGAFPARLWYLTNPEKLVLPQGRITIINTVGNYVIVDSAGTSLTTESDQLGSYVNVIDGQTGVLKCTLQIASINGDRINFRSIPSRTTVLNRTVATSIPLTVGADDYLCAIDGICVPYYGRPTSNFIIQYSMAELTTKLGGDRTVMEQVLAKFEQQVERDWVGRERQMRIQKRSRSWGVPTRRFHWE